MTQLQSMDDIINRKIIFSECGTIEVSRPQRQIYGEMVMFKNQPYDMTEDEMMAADYHAKKGRDHGSRDAIHDMIVTLTEMALRHVIHSSGAHKERPGGP
jgi:hypothetical protein